MWGMEHGALGGHHFSFDIAELAAVGAGMKVKNDADMAHKSRRVIEES